MNTNNRTTVSGLDVKLKDSKSKKKDMTTGDKVFLKATGEKGVVQCIEFYTDVIVEIDGRERKVNINELEKRHEH